jgi:hypothetical protein
MSTSNSAVLSHNNRALGAGTWTGASGTFDAATPLSNLSQLQVPTPFVKVTPAAGEIVLTFQALDEADTAQTFSADTFGLLAVTDATSIAPKPGLPDGAVIEFRDNADDTLLASVTWAALTNRNRPANAFALAAAAAELDTLKVRITGAGTDPIRIGSVWAAPSIREDINRGWGISANDYTTIGRATTTPWPNRRSQADIIPGVMDFLTEDQAYGVAGGDNLKHIFETAGTSRPVVFIPRASTTQRIAHLAVYGLLRPGWTINHRRGPWWTAGFEVEEVR